MELIRSCGAQFLMRVSEQVAGFARRLEELSENDWIVDFTPTSATRRKDPWLPKQITARLIRYQIPGFRPSWLLTSLMESETFKLHELVDLYHRRWTIETIYREWKHGLNIQNLRSHTPSGILKEVHAQLLLSNLVRWIMTEAVEGTSDTPLDLSFLTALSHVKNAILVMVRARPATLPLIHQQLLRDVRSARVRKRPGRSYPRPTDGKAKNRGHGKYQLPARLPHA